jgi:hypothetical protein
MSKTLAVLAATSVWVRGKGTKTTGARAAVANVNKINELTGCYRFTRPAEMPTPTP